MKQRLIISLIVITTVIWFIAGVLSWFNTRENLNEFFDTYQLLLAKQLSGANLDDLKADNQQRSDETIERLLNDGEEDDDALGFAIFNRQGDIVFHDGNNGKDFHFNQNPVGFIDQKVGGDKWRIIWVLSADKQFVVAVGQEAEFRKEMAFEVVSSFFIPWGIGLLFFILASVILISRELKPVKDVAKKISARKSDDLSPIISSNMPKEIQPLINAMNHFLERISVMLEHERSFIYNSAHELRSPLAALKVQLEVALISGNDSFTRNNALCNLEIGIERLSRLVEQLLTLSKLEGGSTYNIDEEILDWPQIINEILCDNEDNAKAKNITIEISDSGRYPLQHGKNILWSLLLRNLIDNAIKYSPVEAKIKIELTKDHLIVSNTGVKVDNLNIEKLGTRFFRPSGQDVDGSGLGLSIVKKIAQIHECSVDFKNFEQGFSVIIKNR
jgi:two-component system sensor histidine kinase QseC